MTNLTRFPNCGGNALRSASFLFFSFLFFSFLTNLKAQVTSCSYYDDISFNGNGDPSYNTCFEDRFKYYFNDGQQGTATDFNAHQLVMTMQVSGDGVFNEEAMRDAIQTLTPPTGLFDYAVSFPDERTFVLVTDCLAGAGWFVPFGSASDPFMEAVVVTSPGGTYTISSVITARINPVTNCGTDCDIPSSNIVTTNSTPACSTDLALELEIENHTPVNGTYTISPHEEVTARLTLKNNSQTATYSLADFDLELQLSDTYGTLPVIGPNDWDAYFVEGTTPAGQPEYESHAVPDHYFHFGSLSTNALLPGETLELLVFAIAPPEELENMLGEAIASVGFARLVDGNGNCCELDASSANVTVVFPGDLPCDPSRGVKFSMEPASGFGDCETGFDILTTLTDATGSPLANISLDKLHLKFTTNSTENLEILEINGLPTGVVAVINCQQEACPNGQGACQNCTVTLDYQGGAPIMLNNGDTWTVVFRGSDATLLEAVDFVSASVNITGATDACVPETSEAGLALPIANHCVYCLDYSIYTGAYGGNTGIQNCQTAFSVYLNVNDTPNNIDEITVGLDFQNPNGLAFSVFNANTCIACPGGPSNCIQVNGNSIFYNYCPGGGTFGTSPIRLFDVIVTGDGCFTDMVFTMETMVHPTGGTACMPMDVSSPSPYEVCSQNCVPDEFIFSGNIHDEDGDAVNVPIDPPGSGPGDAYDSGILIDGSVPDGSCDVLTETLPPVGNETCNGDFEVTVQCPAAGEGTQFGIVPKKDINDLNGVTTFDLVIIQKHILVIELLDSPYKMIAADANKSGTITNLDLIDIRKLILFIDTEFPNNTSWRFVDAAYQFPDPADPWSPPFPEIKIFNIFGSNNMATNQDFVAVKIGDVNGSASCSNGFAPDVVEDRGTGATLLAGLPARTEVGGTVEISFGLDSPVPLAAWELGLRFDPAYLQFVAAVPDTGLEGMHPGNFGATEAAEGKLRAIWFSPYGTDAEFTGRRNFQLRFKVLRPFGGLSEVLSLDDNVMSARAYEGSGSALGIGLRATGETLPAYTPPAVNEIFVEALPNPFSDGLRFVVQAAQPEAFTLGIYDVHGRLVAQRRGEAGQGQTAVRFDGTENWGNGVFHWRLTAGQQVLSGRVVKE